MIKSLSIKNYALIQTLEMNPSPNLNIITGETGAGKTMVVTGLRLLTGGRADASRVRTGASEAGVSLAAAAHRPARRGAASPAMLAA